MEGLGTKQWNVPYVSAEAGKCLLEYKYAGNDASLLYIYLWSPMAEYVASCLPPWIAPNVITLFALFIRFVTDCIVAYYAWTLQGYIPPYACYLYALGYFSYITLDNVDGKQARRTGNSSPLGLLFDHGADALNCVLFTMTVTSLFQTGKNWQLIAFFVCVTMGFYTATLEEYYCGRLDLGVVNAVSDGCVLMYAIGIVSAVFGCGVWTAVKFHGYTLVEILIGVFVVLAIVAILQNYYNIYKCSPRFWNVVTNSAIFFLVMGTFTFHLTMTSLSNFYIRPMVLMYGCMSCKLLLHMMLAHISAQTFNPFRFPVLFVCFIFIGYFLAPGQYRLKEEYVFWPVFVYSMGTYVRTLVRVATEVKHALGINVFIVKPTSAEPAATAVKERADNLDHAKSK